ncbi:MAG: leucine-rich repeat domain-containing protein, partial [Candidatus Dadabacteria bacterium]
KNGRVTKLDLSDMGIEDITGINRLKKLEVLNLSDNQLMSIPAGTFDETPALRELYLEGNGVKAAGELAMEAINWAFCSSWCLSLAIHIAKSGSWALAIAPVPLSLSFIFGFFAIDCFRCRREIKRLEKRGVKVIT